MSSAQVGQVRQEVGQLHAALAVLRELARAAQEAGRLLLDEGEADVLGHRLGQLLAVQLVELRLGVEQVDLARGAFEVDADAVLRLGREVRRLRRQRRARGVRGDEQALVAEQRGEGEQADAAGAGGQEVAAGAGQQLVGGVHARVGQGLGGRLRTQTRAARIILVSSWSNPTWSNGTKPERGTWGNVGLFCVGSYRPSLSR